MKSFGKAPEFVKDPFNGDSFIMAPTLCTEERKSFLKRNNEIIAFLSIGEHALHQFRITLQKQLSVGMIREIVAMNRDILASGFVLGPSA